MKKTIIFLLGLFTMCTMHAQEPEPTAISSEDYRKIALHIQTHYRIPIEAISDTITQINYQIQFQIDEEGRFQEPEIIRKTVECKPCEQELFRIMKNIPKVKPAIQNGRKIKTLYVLPFNLRMQ